jgi:hypothetical protein
MQQTNSILGFPYPFKGNICGYCFVIDVDSGLMADESYRWWYGDNDLYIRAANLGNITKVFANVIHLHGNALTSRNEKLLALTKEDEKLFHSRIESGYYN